MAQSAQRRRVRNFFEPACKSSANIKASTNMSKSSYGFKQLPPPYYEAPPSYSAEQSACNMNPQKPVANIYIQSYDACYDGHRHHYRHSNPHRDHHYYPVEDIDCFCTIL
ncbi:hypothetical protein HHI36_002292 [Cryptolaemus montrouzieri]|uniref:Uncharacterized protein n=1 Tax=Cryptolaemus montrouzieri TaxID=559131 RepID=A0ABD2PA70_9CUCU